MSNSPPEKIEVIAPSRLFALCEWMVQKLVSAECLLIGIIALAFFIRLILIPYGLPLLLYEDEPIYYGHALDCGLGNWNLHYFNKPSFFLYSYATAYYIAYLYTSYLTWKEFVDAFWQNPTYVALVGRLLSIVFATGSVAVLYRIGKRAFSNWVGLAAAFMLAINTIHVRTSPIVISDIPALFFILCAAWFALSIAERGRARDYMLCALMITLAMSFKYNLFSVFFLVAAHFTSYTSRHASFKTALKSAIGDRRLWLSLALIPVLFLILNPMILVDFSTFWRQINLEKRHMLARDAHDASEQWRLMAAFVPVFFKILPKSLEWPVYIAALIGVPYTFWRYRPQAFVLFSFPLVFLLVVLQFQLINAKYLLPLYPFFFLAIAVLLRDAVLFIRSRWLSNQPEERMTVVYTVLIVLLLFPTLAETARYTTIYAKRDTRNFAYQTVKLAARPGDRFLFEPGTLTMNHHITRAGTVVARFQNGQFETEFLSTDALQTQEVKLETLQPQYVLIDFGQADKQKDNNGKTYYKMPYTPQYYAILQTRYRLKDVYSHGSIFLSTNKMREILKTQGFSALYAEIQEHKTDRQRPGPLLLLMERI